MEVLKVEHQDDEEQSEPFYTDCFARSCCHHNSGLCGIFTTSRPPTITIDGTCLGYDL